MLTSLEIYETVLGLKRHVRVIYQELNIWNVFFTGRKKRDLSKRPQKKIAPSINSRQLQNLTALDFDRRRIYIIWIFYEACNNLKFKTDRLSITRHQSEIRFEENKNKNKLSEAAKHDTSQFHYVIGIFPACNKLHLCCW